MYLHSSLKAIVSSHNSVTIDDEEFRVHEKYLLLDLGDKDGALSMINLYDWPDKKDEKPKDEKLQTD